MGNRLSLYKPVSVHVLVEIVVCLDYQLDQKQQIFQTQHPNSQKNYKMGQHLSIIEPIVRFE